MTVSFHLGTALWLLISTIDSARAGATSRAFDYVIVGGGVSGLVVANRLTENENVTAVVLESGESVDTYATMVPYEANNLNASQGLMWDGITSLPEPKLGNSTFSVIVAKVLGGGSVINGMVYDRGSAADYNAWQALGNTGWGFADILPYFKKATTFQPPSPSVAKSYNITWDPEVYGRGPLEVSITDAQFPGIKDYWQAWKAAGVNVPIDGNNGEAFGASWFPNTMDKRTGRRAHARYAYIDPISRRPNLKVLTGSTVQKVIFNDKEKPIVATGVQYTDDATGRVEIVTARKEVVLAAGAIQTPKLLQLSGIGPRSVLEAAGIAVKADLDAVGSNFQDHPWANVIFDTTTTIFPNLNLLTTNATYNTSAWAEYVANKTGPYTYARGNAFAFIPLPSMTPNVSSIISQLNKQKDTSYLPAFYKDNRKLLKGFCAQQAIIANIFQRKDAAVAEFPMNTGDSNNFVAVEKPLSRGTVHINAKSPSGPPDVFHNAFSNPIDKAILGIGLRFLRKVYSHPSLVQKLSLEESVPGSSHTSDEEIFNALLAKGMLSPSLSHPSGTCPMMPEDAGGCVSHELRVYGTSGLSVVDASIIPIIPSQHLQATVYMIGEKAADLIKARA